MPWKLKKNSKQCPVSRPWGVLSKTDGKVVGCHATKKEAVAQLGALYANVDEAAEPVEAEDRTAVAPHDTAVEGGDWDAQANEARLPSPMPVATAKNFYTWYDAETDDEGNTTVDKTDGKLPHHFVDSDGNPGAASSSGVSAALARLNQVEGVSEEARGTMRRHLQGHQPDKDDEGESNAMDPVVETRTLPFTVERADTGDDTGDGLTLEGYAAVFNSRTRIESFFEGTFDEIIAPGSFKRTLNARTPVLQFDHGSHPMIGGMPLGRYERIREDNHGLHVRARLSDNWLTQPVRDAIRDGAVTGMSIRFTVPARKDEWDDSGPVPVRTIREINLFEAGPVVFPAYEDTTVGVRGRDIAAALTDPDVRADVARILTLGTSEPGPAGDGTPGVEPAADSDPPEALRGMTSDQRAGVLRTLTLDALGGTP